MKREDLLKALEIVRPGLASKETIEQSTSFAFMKGRVVTYNDEISISTPVDGMDKDMTGAIKADELYQLLSKIKKDEVDMTITDKEIQLKAGKAKAGMPLQTEIKLPLEELGQMSKWQKLPGEFLEAVRYCMPSCSSNSSYPLLTTINVRADGFVVASDNFRITRYKLAKMPFGFLLPLKASKDLIKYGVDQICQSKGWIHFLTSDGKTQFSCRTFEGEYPKVDPYLEVKGTGMELPQNIGDVLDRAAVFSKSDEITEDRVQITMFNNIMKIRVDGSVGWFEEEARLSYDGPAVTFAVNPGMFKEISTQMRTCTLGEGRMKFTGENWEHVVALPAAKES